MTTLNSKFLCDGCGKDLNNGSLMHCIVVSRMDMETGMVENLHFCITEEKTKGCAEKLLTSAKLKNYSDRKKTDVNSPGTG